MRECDIPMGKGWNKIDIYFRYYLYCTRAMELLYGRNQSIPTLFTLHDQLSFSLRRWSSDRPSISFPSSSFLVLFTSYYFHLELVI